MGERWWCYLVLLSIRCLILYGFSVWLLLVKYCSVILFVVFGEVVFWLWVNSWGMNVNLLSVVSVLLVSVVCNRWWCFSIMSFWVWDMGVFL